MDGRVIRPDDSAPVKEGGVICVDGSVVADIKLRRDEKLAPARLASMGQIHLRKQSLPTVVLEAVLDRMPRQTAGEQLIARDDMVLPSHQRPKAGPANRHEARLGHTPISGPLPNQLLWKAAPSRPPVGGLGGDGWDAAGRSRPAAQPVAA